LSGSLKKCISHQEKYKNVSLSTLFVLFLIEFAKTVRGKIFFVFEIERKSMIRKVLYYSFEYLFNAIHTHSLFVISIQCQISTVKIKANKFEANHYFEKTSFFLNTFQIKSVLLHLSLMISLSNETKKLIVVPKKKKNNVNNLVLSPFVYTDKDEK